MLAFDIETEGLDKYVHKITVACVYDPDNNIKKGFNFTVRSAYAENVAEFLELLDKADVLCAYNGARFDLPFIIEQFGIPQSRYSAWFCKLFDYFEVCKVLLGTSCSLNMLLRENNIPCKTSNGVQAVEWAEEKRWDKLIEYCMQDAVLTHRLARSPSVTIPMEPHCLDELASYKSRERGEGSAAHLAANPFESKKTVIICSFLHASTKPSQGADIVRPTTGTGVGPGFNTFKFCIA